MKRMLLEDAIRQGIITVGDALKGISGHYFAYKPVERIYTALPEETGWKAKQMFQTEQLGWCLERIGDEIHLVADQATEMQLFLCGKIGYESGVKTINRFCQNLYSNSLATKVIGMTKEMIIAGVSRSVKMNDKYWLGESYRCDYPIGEKLGMSYVISHYVYGMNLYNVYNGIERDNCCGIRPVAFLNPNIQIEFRSGDDGSREHPWHFFEEASEVPHTNSLKLELENLIKEGKEGRLRGEEVFTRIEKIVAKMK